jgi:hypothetical protein
MKDIKLKLTEALRTFIMEQASQSFVLPSQTYPTGTYSIERIDKTLIDNALKQIKDYALKNKGNKIGIQIESGESRVTNYDREKSSTGTDNPLPQGELARLRGENLRQYLTTKLGEMVKQGILSVMPEIPEPKVVIGKNEYKKGIDNPKDPKYLNDQYVKLNFYISADAPRKAEDTGMLPMKKTEMGRCLFDMVITFTYIHYKRKPKEMDREDFDSKFFCRGGHVCDEAMFDVYLGTVKIGSINFNNNKSTKGRETGGESAELKNLKEKNPEEYARRYSRYAKIVVTPEMVTEIINSPVARDNKYITLRLHCLGTKECHTSGPEVKVMMGGKVVFEQSCAIKESKIQRTDKPIRLLKMDLCGTNIEKVWLPVEEQPPFREGIDS